MVNITQRQAICAAKQFSLSLLHMFVGTLISPGDAMISRPINNLEKNKLNDNGEY